GDRRITVGAAPEISSQRWGNTMRSPGYVCAVSLLCAVGCTTGDAGRHEVAVSVDTAEDSSRSTSDPVKNFASAQSDDGRRTFRFDTFGDEEFWGDTLQLHLAIEGAANGGVGGGVSPRTALAVGLKVDVDALPGSLRSALAQGQVNLDDPAT